jgi:hypothetical protein
MFHFFHLFVNLLILSVPGSGQNYFLPANTSKLITRINKREKKFSKKIARPPLWTVFLAPLLHPHDLKK